MAAGDHTNLVFLKMEFYSTIFNSDQKISLILHQFNLYVLLTCGKKLVTIEIFLSSHLKP